MRRFGWRFAAELGAATLGCAALAGAVLVRAKPRARSAIAVVDDAYASGARGGRVRAAVYAPRKASSATADRALPYAVVVRAGARENGAAAGFAIELARTGACVADIVCAPDATPDLTRCFDGVADAARALAPRVQALGCDVERPRIVGYGLGGSIAARVALDDALLARAHLNRAEIAGVMTIHGTFDFADAAIDGHPDHDVIVGSFAEAASREAASPRAHVRADAPPMFLLAAANDPPAWARLARQFANALDAAGARGIARFVVPARDGTGLFELGAADDEVRELVTSFVQRGAAPTPVDSRWGTATIWSVHPPLTSESFWSDERLVETRPVDDRFRAALLRVLVDDYELAPYPCSDYQAIPLRAYLDAHASRVGRGDWIVVTNLRDERLVFSERDLDRHEPRIVVGLDGDRNLYRLVARYRMNRGDASSDAPPPTMVRPVGAFLYFPTEPPPALRNLTYAAYGLSPDSFRRVERDPFAALRGVSADLATTLWGEQGCLGCHTLGGAGSRAHHITAEHAAPAGAYALALDTYPRDVLRRFLFEQDAVAASFGVAPLRVPHDTAEALYALVTSRR